jgi:hypothetical protein
MLLSRLSQQVQQLLAGPVGSSRPRRYRLTVESLEARALMSGGLDDTAVVPPPSTTNPASTAPVDDSSSSPDGPGGDGQGTSGGKGTSGGSGGSNGTPGGYPLPPSTGVTLTNGLGVDANPVPVLPPVTSPTGTTSASNTSTKPLPTDPTALSLGGAASPVSGNGTAPVAPVTNSTSTGVVFTAPATPAPRTTLVALTTNVGRHTRSAHARHHHASKRHAHAVHHAGHQPTVVRKAT